MGKVKSKKHMWLYIFIANIIFCLLAVCCLIIKLVVKYGSFESGMAELAKSAFADFGQVLYFTIAENPYITEFKTMYTPINFLFYMPFAILCSTDGAFYKLSSLSAGDYNALILQTWQFWVCLVIYFMIVFTVLFFVLKKMIPLEKLSDKVAFFFSLLFSTLIGFGVVRGSNVFIALVFFAVYVSWYKSDNRLKRELSVLFLAIAGILKLYVLFGGVLLLKDRRWKDVIKCVVYVLLCLFIPFLLYDSPFKTTGVYIKNLFEFAIDEGRIGSDKNISVFNLVYCFFFLFGVEKSVAVTVLCWLFTVSVFVLAIVVCLKTKSVFTQLIVIACVFALVSPVSYLYVLSFMILPILYFVGERKSIGKKRRVFYYITFFVFSFTPLIVLNFFFIYTIFLLAVFAVESVITFKKNDRQPDLSVLKE